MTRPFETLAALACTALIVACGDAPQGSTVLNDRFVAVQRDELNASPSVTGGARRNDTFYLAIKRTELGKRFFLSAFLKQLFPGGVGFAAAETVGTRVVSFKIQNGKLFLFDAASINGESDSFDPTLVLEAWPIVSDSSIFNRDAEASNYVLVDPSAGLNRFSLFSEFFNSAPEYFSVELSYLQGFRQIADGIAFDQVFTGQATGAVHAGESVGEPNVLRLSGTLSVNLRDYQEGAGFATVPAPDETHYFLSSPRIVRNGGFSEQTPVKWNIKRGAKPIRWTISPQVKALAADPFYGRYDIAGAIQKGVENWNQVFGFKAFEAVVGADGADPGSDDTNFIYVDVNPAIGFAFANWRTNPNSGEIRGASVYFNTVFIDGAAAEFDTALAPAPLATVIARAKPMPGLSLGWAGLHAEPLCVLPVHPEAGEDLATVALTKRDRTAATLASSGKELVEAVITHTILHEIGHTLGLRHNFKGSLTYPSTSAMDYLFDEEGVQLTSPGTYDTDAVKYLYGLAPTLPTQDFCTDEQTRADPDCARFDVFANPLENWWGPLYTFELAPWLAGTSEFTPSTYSINSLQAYVRAGATSSLRVRAADLVFGPVSATSPLPGSIPALVNLWGNFMQRRLFLDPSSARSSAANSIVQDPPLASDPDLRARLLPEVGGYLRNLNGAMSYSTRRRSVDILKKVQLLDAYAQLVTARGEIAPLAPSDLQAQDLLLRIDQATTPYFQ